MYLQHFGFTNFPFSITAHGQELFLCQQYREAIAHMYFSLQHPGGIVLLTGEVGTGKTTIARNFLLQQQQSSSLATAFIVNPCVPTVGLLQSICQELGIKNSRSNSIKLYVDKLHQYLLSCHSRQQRVVVVIDEAQHLSFDALEQLRLLTNLETAQGKLLQIILVGQDELQTTILHPSLRQFCQRIVGSFRLQRLNLKQTGEYIRHRLVCANGSSRLIPAALYRPIYKHTQGIPRLINLLCDRALLGTYALNRQWVDRGTLKRAMAEMLSQRLTGQTSAQHLSDELPVIDKLPDQQPVESVDNLSEEFPLGQPGNFAQLRPTAKSARSAQSTRSSQSARLGHTGESVESANTTQPAQPDPSRGHHQTGRDQLRLDLWCKNWLSAKIETGTSKLELVLRGKNWLGSGMRPKLISRAVLIVLVMLSTSWFATDRLIVPGQPDKPHTGLVSVPDGTSNLVQPPVLTQSSVKSGAAKPGAFVPPASPAEPGRLHERQPDTVQNPAPVFEAEPKPANSQTGAGSEPAHNPVLAQQSPPAEYAAPSVQAARRDTPEPVQPPQSTQIVPADLSGLLPEPTEAIGIASLSEVPPAVNGYNSYDALLKLWDIRREPFNASDIPCRAIVAYLLSCAHIKAHLDLVREIGLPTVLEWSSRGNQSKHEALLAGLNQQYALLWLDGKYYRIDVANLERDWQGYSHYFIHAPQDFRTAFKRGSNSDSIAWLIHALSKVDEKYALNQPVVTYNGSLIRSVKNFQQQQGLAADGIAGFSTLARLNRILFGPPTLTTTFD